MFSRSKYLFALSALWISASATPTHKHKPIAERLALLAAYACDNGGGCSGPSFTSGQGQGQAVPQPAADWASRERVILQTLDSTMWELGALLDTIFKKGVIHNVMTNKHYSLVIQRMRDDFHFRAGWDESDTNLSSQQIVRLKALVRMVGYAYFLQNQSPCDSSRFGPDAPHLEMVLKKVQQATCNLRDLLPGVHVASLVANSNVPNSFSFSMRRLRHRQMMMGLTLEDIRKCLTEMTVSVSGARLTIR